MNLSYRTTAADAFQKQLRFKWTRDPQRTDVHSHSSDMENQEVRPFDAFEKRKKKKKTKTVLFLYVFFSNGHEQNRLLFSLIPKLQKANLSAYVTFSPPPRSFFGLFHKHYNMESLSLFVEPGVLRV